MKTLKLKSLARRSRRLTPELGRLEERMLLDAAGLDAHDHEHSDICLDIHPENGLFAFPAVRNAPQGSSPITSGVSLVAGALPNGIPILNSLAGAAASLYLDFDGHFEPTWGSYSNINTPAYDTDNNTASFSAAELTNIQRIWEQVAEDYAPFQINVTTIEPPSFANGQALRVVIGGNGSWSGGTYGGVGYVDSFTNSIVNTVFVFPKNLGNGNPKYTGDAASHEAGHGFGLQHQSSYSSTGTKTEYSSGNGDGAAPIMGNSYSARRSLWWYGTSVTSTTFQNDIDVVARAANGFGLRADDHGNSAASATSLVITGNQLSAAGILATAADIDAFSFTTDTGSVTFTVATPANVSNLAPRIELRDAGGSTLIAAADSTSSFTATVTASLSAGSYRIYVKSTGNTTYSNGAYNQNVGQFTLTGSVVTPTDLVGTPSSLIAAAASTSVVNLSWTDNATNETGFRVERSLNGLAWSVIAANLAANTTSYTDAGLSAGTTYSYRVQAFSTIRSSDYTTPASTTTTPNAPANLAATASSSSRINLTWSDVNGESGYRVERSLDGTSWSLAGTTAAGVTSFADANLAASTTYYYRVLASNSSGLSTPSATASATTQALPRLPTAPTNLVAGLDGSLVNLTWRDNASDEDGFRIERSTNNGRGWTVIAETQAGVTSFTDTSASAGKTNIYRVAAFNSSGSSAYTNNASVSIPRAKGGKSRNIQGAALPDSAVVTPNLTISTPSSSGLAQTALIPVHLAPQAAALTDQVLNLWDNLGRKNRRNAR